MRAIILIFILLGSAVFSYAQKEIAVDAVESSVGDSVKICTKIYGGIFMEKSKRQPTLLNVGAPYPNSALTLVIWPNVRSLFSYKPEDFYKNKKVCILGKVELFQNKPQIVIYSPKQIIAD